MDPAALDRALRVFSHLPPDSLVALEARLAPGPAPVDVSVRLTTPEQARRMPGPAFRPPLRRLLRCWVEEDPALAPASSLWLELDLDTRAGEGLPAPSVCARVQAGWDAEGVVGDLLPALHGRPLGREQAPLLRRALSAIPLSAELLYVSSMQSRPGAPVRLELGGGDAGQLLGCLAGLVPPGSATAGSLAHVREEALPLFEGVERWLLAFDVLEEIQPRLGLGGRFRRSPSRQPGWGELFAHLVEAGLCCPAKRDAALAVSGWDSSRTAPEIWPLSTTGEALPGCLARALSHVKVVARPEGELEAKVYLNVQWVREVGGR